MSATLLDKSKAWSSLHGLSELQDATLSARERTGIEIGTQVQQGLFRVVRTDSTTRSTVVTPLSEWISKERAVAFLNTL